MCLITSSFQSLIVSRISANFIENRLHMSEKVKHFYKVVPCLPVRDLKDTISWYQEILQFREPWFWGDPPSDAGIRRDDLRLIFGVGEPFKGLELMIFVDNVKEVHQEILENNVPLIAELQEESYGLLEFCIEDLNGYRLRIAEGQTTAQA